MFFDKSQSNGGWVLLKLLFTHFLSSEANKSENQTQVHWVRKEFTIFVLCTLLYLKDIAISCSVWLSEICFMHGVQNALR